MSNTEVNPDTSPEMTLVAILDERGLFQGVDKFPLADLTDEHIHLPDGCDLKPGTMRWDRDLKTFLPATAADLVTADADSGALTAIALGFLAVSPVVALPAETLAWMRKHFTAYGFAAGDASTETRLKVRDFLSGGAA